MTISRHSYTCFAQRSTFGAFATGLWLITAFFTGAVAQEHPQIEPEPGGWFGGSQAYEICLASVETDPEIGFERAMAWEDQGGGPPAKHCGAVALISLDLFAEGADRLDQMAQNISNGLNADIRAELLIQAATAWMLEGFPGQALESLRAAEALEPTRIRLVLDIHFDRARAHIMNGEWELAVTSLNQALVIAPNAQEALVLRATAHRVLGQNDQAFADLARLLEDDPEFVPGYLERGLLHHVIGDEAAARADWIRVLIIEPEGGLADAARAHLFDLDFPDGMTE